MTDKVLVRIITTLMVLAMLYIAWSGWQERNTGPQVTIEAPE